MYPSSKKDDEKTPAASASASQPKKKGRKPKAKGFPKRPLSAYNLFFREERQKVLHLDFQSMGKEISARWKRSKPEERAKYEELAKVDAKRYRKDVQAYEEKQRMIQQQYKQKQQKEMSSDRGGAGDEKLPATTTSTGQLGGTMGSQVLRHSSTGEGISSALASTPAFTQNLFLPLAGNPLAAALAASTSAGDTLSMPFASQLSSSQGAALVPGPGASIDELASLEHQARIRQFQVQRLLLEQQLHDQSIAHTIGGSIPASSFLQGQPPLDQQSELLQLLALERLQQQQQQQQQQQMSILPQPNHEPSLISLLRSAQQPNSRLLNEQTLSAGTMLPPANAAAVPRSDTSNLAPSSALSNFLSSGGRDTTLESSRGASSTSVIGQQQQQQTQQQPPPQQQQPQPQLQQLTNQQLEELLRGLYRQG